MARSLRIVCYAVNGGGVGHLTRLLAISRWIRRYALHAGLRPEIVFLTSSEADSVLFHERIASFKVPSKTAAYEAGLDKIAYVALAKQWVWHSVALLRPDLFIVDTFPRGSFGELPGCLDLCRKKAFVYRPMKRELACRPEFQAMLPLYDLVIVPEEASALTVPPEALPRVRHVGPVVVRERAELPSRAEARRALGLPDDAFVVYASAGGGGDPGAGADLEAIVEALSFDPSTHVIVAPGPLHRGRQHFGPRLRTLTGLGAIDWLPAADVAIAGAGYNSFAELMLAGIPSVLVAQDKVADEQHVRASRAFEAGAARLLARPLSPEAVRAAVEPFRNGTLREEASRAARALVPGSGARRAARDLLRLVMPASEVDAAVLAMDDGVLAASRATGLPEASFVEAMRLFDPAPDGLPGKDPAGASAAAVEVLGALAARGLDVTAVLRVMAAFLRRAEGGSVGERAAACLRVAEALAPFEDWAGAVALLKLTPNDGREGPGPLAEGVASLAAELRARCDDLYRGVARVVRGSSNRHATPRPADDEGEIAPAEGAS